MTSHSKDETPRARWERQYERLTRLRDNLEAHHAAQGAKWVAAMKRYYTHRIGLLEAHEPPREDTS